jgi:hypothetical protein
MKIYSRTRHTIYILHNLPINLLICQIITINTNISKYYFLVGDRADCLLELFSNPEDGGDMFLRNPHRPQRDYTILYPRRCNSSSTRLIGANERELGAALLTESSIFLSLNKWIDQ